MKRNKLPVLLMFCLTLILIGGRGAAASYNEEKPGPYTLEEVGEMMKALEPVQSISHKEFERIDFDSNRLYSENCCLMEKDTGKIVYAFNEDEVVYPASLTKIMTTIVALESLNSLDVTYSFTEKMIWDMLAQDASMAGFASGEEVTAKDLVYGTMLPSGGEAAEGLAECASGSVKNHVDKMNLKLKEYGLSKSHFTNVTGLHNPDNVSTAREIAEMVRYGLKDPNFEEVMTNSSYVTTKTNQHPDGVELKYSVIKYQEVMDHSGFEILGGKTGYTEEASLCLASVANVGGKDYILVTLGAPWLETNGATHFADAFTAFNMLLANQ